MSDFTSDVLTTSVTDLSKRVHYATGMVLGVDEFEQDQAYFIERDRLLTRALHGYGVVQGLGVEIDPSPELTEVRVRPGLAIDPSGQHVCIDRTQCAAIKKWLALQNPENAFSPDELTGGSNGSDSTDIEPKEVCLSIVLRYGTCATDFVPIPGEACRSAEESRAASRMADDFSLAIEFEADRPPQVEEYAIRLLGRLLRAVEVRAAGPYLSEENLRGLIEALAAPDVLVSVDENNDVSVVDDVSLIALAEAAGVTDADGIRLPDGDGPYPVIRIEPGTETSILRAIEQTWVENVRRKLLTKGYDDKADALETGRGTNGRCQPVTRGDNGIVLGTFCLSVVPNEEDGLRPSDDQTNDEGGLTTDTLELSTDARPRLLASRVLREAAVLDRSHTRSGDDDGEFAGTPAGGDLTGTYPDPQVAGLRGQAVSMEPGDSDLSLEAGQVLTYDGSTWRPEPVTSDGEAAPTHVQEGLSRIIATNWTHGGSHRLDLLTLRLRRNDDQLVRPGLAVAFGVRRLGDRSSLAAEGPGLVRAGTLTPEVFRAYIELNANEYTGMGAPGLNGRLRLAAADVLPLVEVQLEERETGPAIVGGTVGPAEERARGAVLILPEAFRRVLPQAVDDRIEVEIRGDFILDAEGRAIDAEFVRGQLPTGDRPRRGSRSGNVGVQGGRFESWFFAEPTDGSVIDLNRAGREELMILPNVGSIIAERIIEFREQLGERITSAAQLTEVRGLTRNQIRDWEGLTEPPL